MKPAYGSHNEVKFLLCSDTQSRIGACRCIDDSAGRTGEGLLTTEFLHVGDVVVKVVERDIQSILLDPVAQVSIAAAIPRQHFDRPAAAMHPFEIREKPCAAIVTGAVTCQQNGNAWRLVNQCTKHMDLKRLVNRLFCVSARAAFVKFDL